MFQITKFWDMLDGMFKNTIEREPYFKDNLGILINIGYTFIVHFKFN